MKYNPCPILGQFKNLHYNKCNAGSKFCFKNTLLLDPLNSNLFCIKSVSLLNEFGSDLREHCA